MVVGTETDDLPVHLEELGTSAGTSIVPEVAPDRPGVVGIAVVDHQHHQALVLQELAGAAAAVAEGIGLDSGLRLAVNTATGPVMSCSGWRGGDRQGALLSWTRKINGQ